jgi:hypothetical protein
MFAARWRPGGRIFNGLDRQAKCVWDGRMRIAKHPAVSLLSLLPNRTAPVTRQPSSPTAAAGPTKPTAHPTGPTASTSPFANLFQQLSGGTAASGLATNTVSPASIFGGASSVTPVGTAAASSPAPATAKTGAAAAAAPLDTAATAQAPGIQALVTAIMSGSFKPTYVTDPSQLQETTPVGTDTMPSFYYASDATAQQLASLLGGTVVQTTAFGQDPGWNEPLANFIQLPNGQTFNAADISYYANCGSEGPAQLTADLTAAINEGSALTNYHLYGGSLPIFPTGYVGPPIAGMTYPAGSIGADGNVVNPAMHSS